MQARRKKFENVRIAKKSKDEADEKAVSKEKTRKDRKDKLKKKKRLIIRNLSFQVTKEELQEVFAKFGNVLEVNIPLKSDGKKRGFAFVQYDDTKSLIKAMKALNNKDIHGRRVAIDYAVDKTSYQLKLQSIKQENEKAPKSIDRKLDSESEDESEEEKPDINLIEEDLESIDENEKRANEFLKEFDSGFDTVQSDDDSSDESSADESAEEEEEEDEDVSNVKQNKTFNKRSSEDVSEGKTIFLRNVSFTTTKESLTEAMEKYGECEYCVICIDPFTDHSKGTAFVKFKAKESADKLMLASWDEPGVLVDGRKLMCSPAISRGDISLQKNEEKKPKDKRNLNLLRVGLIMPNSPESEGVSQSDMVKRSQLEMLKRQKLKNVNFFVSDKRLMIHNVPKTLNDVQLRKLFKDAAGKGAVITEARVMREFKKTNAEGVPLSKGFGFVSFDKHEDALKALTALNNNPSIFTAMKRPIVEFSVENKVALLSKERRKEKIQQRNKKRTEEKRARQLSQNTNNKSETVSDVKVSSKKAKKRKNSRSKVKEEKIDNSEAHSETGSPRKKRKKNKKGNCETSEIIESNSVAQRDSLNGKDKNSETKQKKQKRKHRFEKKGDKEKTNRSNQECFNSLVDSFKEKLLNKMA